VYGHVPDPLEHFSQPTLFYSIVHAKSGWAPSGRASNLSRSKGGRGGRIFALPSRNVSQHALETALGRLICDDTFRREFFRDAEGAALRVGLKLTPIELTSLRKINLATIESLARMVDDRIRRAEEPEPRRRT